MKNINNIYYSLVIGVYLIIQFFLLKKISLWLLYGIDSYQPTISDLLFYLLLSLVGLLIIVSCNVAFTFLSVISIRQITKILPERIYAIWFTGIISVMFSVTLIFQIWSALRTVPTLVMFFFLLIVISRVIYVNIIITNENMYVKTLSAESNISEKQFRSEMKEVMKKTKAEQDIVSKIKKQIDELNSAGDDEYS